MMMTTGTGKSMPRGATSACSLSLSAFVVVTHLVKCTFGYVYDVGVVLESEQLTCLPVY
jgi:hypothetical protein